MEALGERHRSFAEPPPNPWSHNRVALEDHSWFNDNDHREDAAPEYMEVSSHDAQAENHQAGAVTDLPPTYEATDLPEYDIDDPEAPPLRIYRLQQVSRALQLFVSADPAEEISYRLTTRTSPKLFSKKADITLYRSTAHSETEGNGLPASNINTNPPLPSNPPERRSSRSGFRLPRRASAPPSSPSPPPSILSTNDTSSSSSTTIDTPLAKINFDDSAQLPWMPRATITLLSPSSPSTYTLALEAPNFRVWRFRLPTTPASESQQQQQQQRQRLFLWEIPERGPPVYSLFDSARRQPLARFEHSGVGTRATKGGEVGWLSVLRVEEMPGGPDEVLIVASLALAMAHFRRMGRHHWGLEERLISAGVYRSMSVGMIS